MTTSWSTLVQVEDLATALGREDLAVVDCRHSLSDPEAGEAAFAAGHVPGAVRADMDRDLSATAAPGAGGGRQRELLEYHGEPELVPHRISGVTASILYNLRERLARIREERA